MNAPALSADLSGDGSRSGHGDRLFLLLLLLRRNVGDARRLGLRLGQLNRLLLRRRLLRVELRLLLRRDARFARNLALCRALLRHDGAMPPVPLRLLRLSLQRRLEPGLALAHDVARHALAPRNDDGDGRAALGEQTNIIIIKQTKE